MQVSRRDPYLNDALEVLDRHLERAKGDIRLAYTYLSARELEFVVSEVERSLDFRYYSENYHVIQSEFEGLKCLYPWWESQEILYGYILADQLAGKQVKILVLKARQEGISEIVQAMLFHKTIFTEACNTAVVAQDPDAADFLFSKSRNAYDCLPWWMRPEIRYEEAGRHMVFDRKRDIDRLMDSGLKSRLMVEASNKMTGVLVGKTLRAAHLCLSARNPLILKNSFLTSIANAQVGFEVRSPRGFSRVSGFYVRPAEEIYEGAEKGYKITPWCNSAFPIEGTGNHEVLTINVYKGHGGGKKTRKRELKELSKIGFKDSLVIPVRPISLCGVFPSSDSTPKRKQGGGINCSWQVPVATREFGFACGLYLAEGSLTRAQVCLSLDCDEGDLADRFALAVGCEHSGPKLNKDSRSANFSFYNSVMARWFLSTLGKCDDKRVPDFFWNMGRDFLSGVVEGMILGDGHVHPTQQAIYFCSVRAQLVIAIREAVMSLGFGYAGITKRDAGFHYGRNCKEMWTIVFTKQSSVAMRRKFGWAESAATRETRGCHWYYSPDKTEIFVTIRKIERVDLDLVYDIEVDDPSHLFSLPGATTHNSELSQWNNAEVLSQQLLPTMNAPDELAIAESTARGRTGLWYRFYKSAMKGEVDWRPVFIEFFRVKKYSLPIPKDKTFELTPEEIALRIKVRKETKHVLTDEQLHWRREKIKEFIAIEGEEFRFYQEFPITAIESFQSSGRCAFDRRKLQKMLETQCVPPKFYGEIRLETEKGKIRPRCQVTKVKDGDFVPLAERYGSRLYIWEMPEEGVEYYVGGDVAAGIEGMDYSCLQVFKVGRGPIPDTQVAEWHGWINPTPFASVGAALGYMYNTCEISMEGNSDVGGMANSELMRVLEYPRIFVWKHYDKVKNFVTSFFGWYTNRKSRGQLIVSWKEAIDDGTVIIRSEFLIDECLDFTNEDGGKRFEAGEENDDRLFAAMIGRWCSHDMDWGMENARPNSDAEDSPADAMRKKKMDFANTDFAPAYDGPPSRHKKNNVPQMAEAVARNFLDPRANSDVTAVGDEWKLT